MARYAIPPHVKNVRVCVAQGGAFAVWNGKTDKDEFRIVVRKRKQAEEIVQKINKGNHNGVIEVFS